MDAAAKISGPKEPSVAAVVPCYMTGPGVLDVLAAMPKDVDRIIVVDDACPDGTGSLVRSNVDDERVRIIVLPQNLGVGGATIAGYRAALDEGHGIIVKLDGDGQMDPRLIPGLIRPIVNQSADYVKGNRFFDLDALRSMPIVRKLGNAGLSFVTKASSGYWQIMDPTNGYTAIHSDVLGLLPLDKIDTRFFFESDLLFRLGTIGAVVVDAPMRAVYGTEISQLNPTAHIAPFLAKNARNLAKRLVYSYLLRGFSVASIELITGALLMAFGLAYGVQAWIISVRTGVAATAGTVMLSGLPVFLGTQFILGFLAADMARGPQVPVHTRTSSLLRRENS